MARADCAAADRGRRFDHLQGGQICAFAWRERTAGENPRDYLSIRLGDSGLSEPLSAARPNSDFRHIPINAVVKQSIQRGEAADAEAASRQHDEFAAALRKAGVMVHHLDQVQHLPLQPYTRDSSPTTPWGTVTLPMARVERRGEFVSILKMFARVDRPSSTTP